MSGSEPAGQYGVAVASEHALVADAVRTSLADRGFESTVLRWPGERLAGPRRPAPSRAGPDVGLLISDLDRWTRVRASTLLLSRVPVPWVVLTGAPDGPMWGAALEAGATLVLPSSTGFQEVCDALLVTARGELTTPAPERERLVGLWEALLERREVVGQRVQSLTPREHEVLTMLYAGDPVARIAELLEISPATVRSQVKAVLRKLQVNSQLGAVAALDDLMEMQELEGVAI
ncbi:DNA-binding response regulator, NarL/FixJ family, contains REC and HTH domains [Nocardioides terrae]|uniref:DNA-binding response regulator, NarL/FixJ family, contains REC and HTH domains n=1 Tax=Nocardioides terrae TaxID=574651 RepID=A0A1I1HUP2_9ACTN|nr:LuxR C-terminal-related transcriptional regulator [Nocardioides terrae]SFC27601.1 DNA-binding response regulator, NarL/FixJ family, contains REC and HTH domains [Nocardioides terrae]